MKKDNNIERKHPKTALLLLLAAVCLIGACGSQSKQYEAITQENADYAMMGEAAVAEEAVEYKDMAEEAGMMDTAQSGGSADAGAETDGPINDSLAGRKLIKEITMEVETESYDAMMTTATEQVAALGGYIESSYTTGDGRSGNTRYSEICARIPKENMEAFIKAVEGSSSVRYKRETVEDVTLQYVDLESRKKSLQTEQTRLLELMEQAQNVEDIITIESRLSEVRYQLESMESQLRTYDNRIDYSTIYLNISEVVRLSPASGDKTSAWERIRIGFTENLYRLGNDLQNLAIGFVISLPYLLVWLLAILIFAAVVLRLRRRLHRRREEKMQVWQQTVGQQQMMGQQKEKQEDNGKE